MHTTTEERLKPVLLERHMLASPGDIQKLNELYRALKHDPTINYSREQLQKLVGNTQQNTYVIRIDRVIAGMGSMITFLEPGGGKAFIEQVATHPVYQRRGIARALVGELLRLARLQGCRQVTLTSNPEQRENANKMYIAMGFTIHDTNVFNFDLTTAA